MYSGSSASHSPTAREARPIVGSGDTCYELRFDDLFRPGRGYAFPCDAEGHVDIDRLSEHARNNYFFARGAIGAEFHCPVTREVAGAQR